MLSWNISQSVSAMPVSPTLIAAPLTRNPKLGTRNISFFPCEIKEDRATGKKSDNGHDRISGIPCHNGYQTHQKRTDDCSELTEHIIEAKESRCTLRRDHLSIERSAQRLNAALHETDRHCQHIEFHFPIHEIAPHAHPDIDCDSNENTILCSQLFTHSAKAYSRREAHELRDQQGNDERTFIESER